MWESSPGVSSAPCSTPCSRAPAGCTSRRRSCGGSWRGSPRWWPRCSCGSSPGASVGGRERRRGKRRAPPPRRPPLSPAPPAALLDAAGWRAELERRLAEGRIPEALEALWWWLARSLAGAEAEPDWTSRDLGARSRRKGLQRDQLRDLVRRLDAFTYGPRPPAADDLRALLGRLEESLA